LAESYGTLVDILSTMERNQTYLNTNPKCEPQLGRRGLYSSPGSSERALLWVLNYSDGRHDLLDIAELSGLTFACVDEAATRLLDAGLLTVPAGHEDSQEESNEQRG
jgi:aminopeptidase-like protein